MKKLILTLMITTSFPLFAALSDCRENPEPFGAVYVTDSQALVSYYFTCDEESANCDKLTLVKIIDDPNHNEGLCHVEKQQNKLNNDEESISAALEILIGEIKEYRFYDEPFDETKNDYERIVGPRHSFDLPFTRLAYALRISFTAAKDLYHAPALYRKNKKSIAAFVDSGDKAFTDMTDSGLQGETISMDRRAEPDKVFSFIYALVGTFNN